MWSEARRPQSAAAVSSSTRTIVSVAGERKLFASLAAKTRRTGGCGRTATRAMPAGVRESARGYADCIRAGKEPPVERVHAQFIEKGGHFYVCPICFNERDLDEKDLVEGAQLQGATPLMQFAGDGATTFSY